MEVQIRFLRQGLIKAEAPEHFDKWSPEDRIAWAQESLDAKTDSDLLAAMADFENPERDGWFDGGILADAIENENGEVIVMTKEWQMFSSGEGSDIADQ